MDYKDFLDISPYSLSRHEKEILLTQELSELTKYHYEHCIEYKGMLDLIGFNLEVVDSYYDIPFLPVRLFKELDMLSVDEKDVFKILTSSGTTGQSVSKIYLDKTTASNQQKTLVKIVSSFTGSGRMPMLIIDCPSVVKHRSIFSARGAGILGFSIFGTDNTFALDDDMNLNVRAIAEFLEKHKDKKILIFGFTFMIWQHFYMELLKRKKQSGDTFDISNGILIHGGGWKKLVSEAVSSQEFHDRIKSVCGLDNIYDYYGMVEQTGCIYMQCEHGHLHASIFSDIIIRNPIDFTVSRVGEKGIIQVLSTIPKSYPGHSLLTEDEGILLGEDDCICGRKGKYFKILGRLKNAELRGCSDTYAAQF